MGWNRGGVIGWTGLGPAVGGGVGGGRRRPRMDLRGEVGDEGTGGALRAIGVEREFDPGDVVLLPGKAGGGDVAAVGDSGRPLPQVGVSPERSGSVGWAPPSRAPLIVAASRKQRESDGPGKWDKHPAPTGYVLLRSKEDSSQGGGDAAATKTSELTRGAGGPDNQAVSQARTVYESSVSLPEAREEALGYLQGHGFTRRADGGLIAPGETAGVVARQADGKVDISGEIPRDGAWVGGRGPLLIPPSSRWMGADLGVGSGTGVVKAGGGFSDGPIVPKVFGGKGWLGDVPNPYAGMLGAVDSSAIQSKPGKQDLPGIRPDGRGGDSFDGRGEVSGDGATKVYENAAGGGLGGSKLSTPTAKAPGLSSGEPVVISGYMPDALERLRHHGRTLPSEPNIPKDSPLTRDQGKYVEDWVTLNLQTRLPGFGRLPADDQKRMVREGIALYYDPDKLEKLWATGGWTKEIFRRTRAQKLPDPGQFPDRSPEYNKFLPSMRKVSPLDSDEWPKYVEAATRIVDSHPYFRVPDPNSDSDEPVMPITGARRADYIHRVAMQLAGVTQDGYDHAQSQRDAGSRSMQATLGASWFGTSSQVLGTLFKSVGAQRLGQFYEDTGSDLLANGVNPNHVWTRELGETLGGITPALGIYAAGGFVPMLVAGTLISGRSAYDRGKEAKLSDAQLGGYVGLHMLSSVATTLIMRRFAPSSSAGATAHGAGAGFGGNVVANAIDKLFINSNISLLDNSFQATVGGGIMGYTTQRGPFWKAQAGTAPAQPKGRAPSFLGMNPEEFKMLRARLSAVKYLDEAALKKMGVKDPARVKQALGRLSKMGEFETPEGLWKASMHPEFLDAFHEMMAGLDHAPGSSSERASIVGPRTPDGKVDLFANGGVIENQPTVSTKTPIKTPLIASPPGALPIDFIMDSEDEVAVNYKRRLNKDADGETDLIGHGDSDSIMLGDRPLSAKKAAKIIRRLAQFKGQPIRLFSCNTGARPDGFAQQLANELKVTVWAPNDYLWMHPDGRYSVGGGESVEYAGGIKRFLPVYPHTGKFVRFEPKINP